jgi:hypothetical protein
MTPLSDEFLADEYAKNNYLCIDTGIDSDLCYLLFSSHGLYYPDEEETFRETIIEKDRYEWKWVVANSTIPQKAGKIIYIRDLYKEFYCKGISAEYSTIDSTLQLLEQLTKGYRTVTVGSSAGGYMAALTAAQLNSLYCFDFSGHFFIQSKVPNQYQDLRSYLESYQGSIYYFYPGNCSGDIEQYRNVEGLTCIKPFPFQCAKHAETMFTGNMCYIIDRSGEEMDKLWMRYSKQKAIGKVAFLMQTVPFHAMIKIGHHEIKGFINRRLGRFDNGV